MARKLVLAKLGVYNREHRDRPAACSGNLETQKWKLLLPFSSPSPVNIKSCASPKLFTSLKSVTYVIVIHTPFAITGSRCYKRLGLLCALILGFFRARRNLLPENLTIGLPDPDDLSSVLICMLLVREHVSALARPRGPQGNSCASPKFHPRRKKSRFALCLDCTRLVIRQFPLPSFPDRSLFRLVPKTEFFWSKTLCGVELSRNSLIKRVIFPVFFPVSREIGVEKSSHETASTSGLHATIPRPC